MTSSISAGAKVSFPAATGVCVVNTVRERADATASVNDRPAATPCLASSRAAIDACPSLRCTTPGSIPRARSARTPPIPSSAYCASRVPWSPVYRRPVIQRSTTLFSGQFASSRYSGTRPTSMRQTWIFTSRPRMGTESTTGAPSDPVTSAPGNREGSDGIQ